jgi:hypothetical protein
MDAVRDRLPLHVLVASGRVAGCTLALGLAVRGYAGSINCAYAFGAPRENNESTARIDREPTLDRKASGRGARAVAGRRTT